MKVSFATKCYEQMTPGELAEQALQRGEAKRSSSEALVVATGRFTGRSPADKYIVRDDITEAKIDWNHFNRAIGETSFLRLKTKLLAYLNEQPAIWARNMFACADSNYRLAIRIVTENPWANLFAANMFIEPSEDELTDFRPGWQILQAPGFLADPQTDGTANGNFTIISFTHRMILIGGSAYTGEIKKSVFTVLNFLLPHDQDVLSMHCSANEGATGDVALFFGLSGTGKTTLSTDPDRALIGDDEHGWSDAGIFNFEGGCYAKVINLSPESEPGIFGAIRRGALVENVRLEQTGEIDYTDHSITENTRASYPLHFIANAKLPSSSGHPRHIFFLSCDACGVLPPISKLTDEQAIYYFLNGYTAKVAATEQGITEPRLTFSPCFGAPFLPLHPVFYALQLARRLKTHKAEVWLVNSGWTGGPYGEGERISIAATRAMIRAAISGQLDTIAYSLHPIFGLKMPVTCPHVDGRLLNPCDTWKDTAAYDAMATKLNDELEENYRQYYRSLPISEWRFL